MAASITDIFVNDGSLVPWGLQGNAARSYRVPHHGLSGGRKGPGPTVLDNPSCTRPVNGRERAVVPVTGAACEVLSWRQGRRQSDFEKTHEQLDERSGSNHDAVGSRPGERSGAGPPVITAATRSCYEQAIYVRPPHTNECMRSLSEPPKSSQRSTPQQRLDDREWRNDVFNPQNRQREGAAGTIKRRVRRVRRVVRVQ